MKNDFVSRPGNTGQGMIPIMSHRMTPKAASTIDSACSTNLKEVPSELICAVEDYYKSHPVNDVVAAKYLKSQGYSGATRKTVALIRGSYLN
jgi:hypothetical protein